MPISLKLHNRFLGRLACTVFALPVLLAIGGCWDRVDINTLAVVQMISIDLSPSGDIAVGVQIVIPADAASGVGGGGGGGAGGLRPVYTLTGVGKTLIQSFTSLQSKTSRRFFFGNVQVLAVGEAYARRGVSPLLDAFSRQLQLREAIDVVVTQGPALKLLQARPRLESLPGAALRALIGQSVVPDLSVLQLGLQINRKGIDPALPWIEINTTTDQLNGSQTAQASQQGTSRETQLPSEKEEFRLAGVGLMRGDKLVSFMKLREARGLGWLRGTVPSAYIQVEWPPPGHAARPLTPAPQASNPEPGQGSRNTPAAPGAGQPGANTVVLRITRSTTKWKAQVSGDRVTAQVELIGEDDVEENPGGADVTNLPTVQVLNRALDDAVAARIRSTIQIAQAANSDILGLGQEIARSDPATWMRIRNRWSSLFPKAVITEKPKMLTRRYGFSSQAVPDHTWQIIQ